jgi:tritrans,polycis-undecaprenyl-diphosphate synthase [geranylgeranyl-diphosphate specific]
MLKGFLSVIGAYKLYEKWLWNQVKNDVKPGHIAIILDGNRRWASEKALNPWFGHEKGAEKVDQLLDWCLKLGVKSITLYAFSTENFRRSRNEVEEIMRIAQEQFRKILTDERIHKNEIHVKVIGRLSLLPKDLQQLIMDVEKATQGYDDHFLNLALAYGGRAEIVDAAKKIADKVHEGKLSPEEIDEQVFEKYLYTSHMSKQDQNFWRGKIKRLFAVAVRI